jgi:molybdopterin molybdotransferase
VGCSDRSARGGAPLTSVEEHLADCLAAVDRTTPIEVPVEGALDLLLAEDVVSAVALPGFDNSAMDGYAVRVTDVAAAGPERPVVLPVHADLRAGAVEPVALVPGAAARIMTGAPIPRGADAVVPVEWTDAGTSVVEVRRPPAPDQFIRRAGQDVNVGESVLGAGTRITPRHVALLAAVGRASVRAHPPPRVVVLSRPLARGQVYDANGYGLVAAARELGAEVRHGGIVPDDGAAVRAALTAALADADVVITSGGVSAGAYDTVKAVLREVGTVRFTRVAMQPGMPQGFGRLGPADVPIFTLPGNPVSSLVSFEIFVRPVLRKLAGERSLHRPTVAAVAGASWSSPAGRRQYVRGVLDTRGDSVVVTPAGGQGSHLVAGLASAECLAVVLEEVTLVEVGCPLTCLVLERGRR